MRHSLLGLIFMTTSATVFAQATPITVPQTSTPSTNGTITLSGCVGGGVGSAPITMMSPTMTPATIQPGSVASAATPTTSPPSITPPIYQPPSTPSPTAP